MSESEMEDEVWSDVPDFEGIYMVSSKGRVRSLERITIRSNGRPYKISEKFLKLPSTKSGTISLNNDGVCVIKSLRRLVFEVFSKEKIPDGMMVVCLKEEANNFCISDMALLSHSEAEILRRERIRESASPSIKDIEWRTRSDGSKYFRGFS